MTIEHIYKKNVESLYRYAYTRLKSKEKAEDVVSETFTRFCNDFEKIRLRKIDTKIWLFAIARNILRDIYKERFAGSDSEILENLPSEEVSLEDKAVEDDLKNQLVNILNELDADTKDVIVMRLWEDMHFADIAIVLEISVNTVKSRYFRGLEKIRSIIAEQEELAKNKAGLTLGSVLYAVTSLKYLDEFQVNRLFSNQIETQILDQIKNLYFKNINMDTAKVPDASIVSKTGDTLVPQNIPVKTMPRLLYPVLAGVGAVVLVAGGLGIYLSTRDDDNRSNTTTSSSSTSTVSTSTTSVSDPYEEWKTYENTTYNYKLRYPSDWVVDDSKADFDSYEAANKSQNFAYLLISNNSGYEFQFKQTFPNDQLLGRGITCVFDDKQEDPMNIYDKYFGESIDLNNTFNFEIKRNQERQEINNQNYILCQRYNDIGDYYSQGLFFDTLNSLWMISYLTPSDEEESQIDILDLIFASLEKTDPYANWISKTDTVIPWTFNEASQEYSFKLPETAKYSKITNSGGYGELIVIEGTDYKFSIGIPYEVNYPNSYKTVKELFTSSNLGTIYRVSGIGYSQYGKFVQGGEENGTYMYLDNLEFNNKCSAIGYLALDQTYLIDTPCGGPLIHIDSNSNIATNYFQVICESKTETGVSTCDGIMENLSVKSLK